MAMTESDRSTMVGVFEDQAQAEQAVNELRSAGFSDDQINLVVRSAKVASEDIVTDEQKPLALRNEGSNPEERRAEAEEEITATEMTPSVLRVKPEVTRTVVTVQAAGREQEALGILHRNGANNANIPDALEPELAPILGAETDDTSHKREEVSKVPSTDTFFDAPEGSSSSGKPPAR